MSKDEKIIEKLKKLQALANGGKAGEADNAARMLTKLLAKHRMSFKDIEVVQDTIQRNYNKVGRSSWERYLARTVAEFCSCKFYFGSYGSRGTGVYVGYTEDAEYAEYLFTVAYRQIQATVATEKGLGNISGRREMNEYRYNMVLGLSEKLKEIKSEIDREEPGYGLVVIDREKKVKGWIESNLRIRSVSSTGYGSNAKAKAAGKAINVNRGVGGRGQKKLGQG